MIEHLEDWPAVAGRPGLVQGAYGAAGNLELVVPATDDGLWVGWFNADPTDAHAGAVRLRWSGALRFGHGRRYTCATIAQVAAGDQALEVLAIDEDGQLVRHVWTSPHGFRDFGVVRDNVAAVSAVLVLPDGRHAAVAADTDTSAWLLTGSVTDHPAWQPHAEALGFEADDLDAGVHVGHVDVVSVIRGLATLHCPGTGPVALGAAAAARLAVDRHRSRWLLRVGPAQAEVSVIGEAVSADLPVGEAVAIAATRIDGVDRVDLVARRGDALQHVAVARSGRRLVVAAGQPVRAQVWVEEEGSTAHRG